MKRSKLGWVLCMIALCIILYTIVSSRSDDKVSVILGGVEGSMVQSDRMTFLDPNATEVEETVVEDDWPKIDLEDTVYTIVNDSHLLSSAFVPETDTISGTNMRISVTALPYANALIQNLKDAGFSVVIGGAYRSFSYQSQLFNSKASQIAYGYGVTDYMDPRYQEAVEEARKITMFPGSSEHQLGLSMDIYDKNYRTLVYENMNQEFFSYLDEHCAEYGFIKRYPTKKLLLTGWDEPWHYRFVGVEAAKFIMERGLSYEEFYAHYDPTFEYGYK